MRFVCSSHISHLSCKCLIRRRLACHEHCNCRLAPASFGQAVVTVPQPLPIRSRQRFRVCAARRFRCQGFRHHEYRLATQLSPMRYCANAMCILVPPYHPSLDRNPRSVFCMSRAGLACVLGVPRASRISSLATSIAIAGLHPPRLAEPLPTAHPRTSLWACRVHAFRGRSAAIVAQGMRRAVRFGNVEQSFRDPRCYGVPVSCNDDGRQQACSHRSRVQGSETGEKPTLTSGRLGSAAGAATALAAAAAKAPAAKAAEATPAAGNAPVAESPAAASTAALAVAADEAASSLASTATAFDIAATSMQKPVLPEATKTLVARDLMKHIIPYVKEHLPAVLASINFQPWVSEMDLAAQPPLAVPSDPGTQGGDPSSSYKERWVPENCRTACKATGLYEAAGNLCWVDPEVDGETVVPFTDPSWHMVVEAADAMFNPAEYKDGRERIRFPVTLSCFWRSGDTGFFAASGNTFPRGGLVLLGGHVFVFAWYIAVFRAMEAAMNERVRMLFECALTTTITLFTTCDPVKLSLESVRMGELVRLSASAAADSFVTFARKVDVICGCDKLELNKLVKLELRHNGSIVNAAMISVIGALRKVRSPQVDALFASLEREFGSDVVTGSYNKLKLLIGTCKQMPESCSWVLESMLVGLRRKEVRVEDFLLHNFQSNRDGPNFMQTSLAQMVAINHLVSLKDNVAAVDSSLAKILEEKITSKLCRPALFNTAYPVCSVSNENAEDATLPDKANEQAPSNFQAELADLPRGAQSLADIFKRVFEGFYSDAISTLASSSNPQHTLQELEEPLAHLRNQ